MYMFWLGTIHKEREKISTLWMWQSAEGGGLLLAVIVGRRSPPPPFPHEVGPKEPQNQLF
jgi:hypothetical protein